jgi:hypothetical protein
MIEVNIEEAYREACRALGETIVRERLLMKELEKQQAINAGFNPFGARIESSPDTPKRSNSKDATKNKQQPGS